MASAAEAFGKAVRRAREKRGLSQEDFAERCGLHRNAIGLLERGKRAPTLETIIEIARALEMRPSRSWL